MNWPWVEPEAMPIFLFDHFLCDQWIATGNPDETVREWSGPEERAKDSGGWSRTLKSGGWSVRQSWQSAEHTGPMRLHQLVTNTGPAGELLLDVGVLAGHTSLKPDEGDIGHPLRLGGQGFLSLEHPTGYHAGWPAEDRVSLWYFPGKTVPAGGAFVLPDVLLSLDAEKSPEAQFGDYLESMNPGRRDPIAVYDPYGTNDYGFGLTPRERDFGMDDARVSLGHLDGAARLGLHFDYYVLDVGWTEPSGDFTQARTDLWPNGLAELAGEVQKRGMSLGLWFATSFADWGVAGNPDLDPLRVPGPGGKWSAAETNGHGCKLWDFTRNFCLATSYCDLLESGIRHHIGHSGVRLIKLDAGNFYCNAAHHEHLPGKYSTTAMHERLWEMSRRLKESCPDLFVVWYWGIQSPFFLTTGDTIFETRLGMEGSNLSDVPCWSLRDSAMRNIDMALRHTPWVPPRRKDTLGIWLAATTWGNYMGNSGLDNSAAIEVARGHLIFPQIWGNLNLLGENLTRGLARRQDWLRANAGLLQGERRPIGHPCRDDRYGYAYGEDGNRIELVTPGSSRLEVSDPWLSVVVPLAAPCQWSVAPGHPHTGRILLLVRARDKNGCLLRVEQAGEWPQFFWHSPAIEAVWETTWPRHDYVWKGSSWKVWLSEPMSLTHFSGTLEALPPSRSRQGIQWSVELGGISCADHSRFAASDIAG
ncbi:MAG: hypothetical protein WC003_16255 [Terrimicrobiaceae bacterium]